MNLVPKNASRAVNRGLLKLNAASPTLLVVGGVGGLIATAVLAAKATRKIDPILDEHHVRRDELETSAKDPSGRELAKVYAITGMELTKLYGPTLFIGTTSAIAVLGGHKILRGRQLATMAAYSGLLEQFQGYRKRVAQTLGEDMEKHLYEGAHGEWKETENRGEYKLEPVWNPDDSKAFMRPWFDETCSNWTNDPQSNYLFLKGVQAHMNNLLQIRGHLFLSEVLDNLKLPRTTESIVTGWLYERGSGDDFVDFGFMTSDDPHTVAFRNQKESTVRLNFNCDGVIWNKI